MNFRIFRYFMVSTPSTTRWICFEMTQRSPEVSPVLCTTTAKKKSNKVKLQFKRKFYFLTKSFVHNWERLSLGRYTNACFPIARLPPHSCSS